MMFVKKNFIVGIAALFGVAFVVVLVSMNQHVYANSSTDGWYMAGANPQRTSWVVDEVLGHNSIVWYRVFEPYISRKVQLIVSNNIIFVSTESGLYSLDTSGEVKWIYKTQMPLGHSPTVIGSVAYVGGHDRMIHAVNTTNGELIWQSAKAGSGFQVNPVVTDGKVFAGNRDGNFYAFDQSSGSLLWSYKTDGPILSSAAYADGVLFFASNDTYLYAIDVQGNLKWKQKTQLRSFDSYWPVIYKDKVIFVGGVATRLYSGIVKNDQISPLNYDNPELLPINWPGVDVSGEYFANNTRIMDFSIMQNYLAENPHLRVFQVRNIHDGHEEYIAPVVKYGGEAGSPYPPIVNSNDGFLYANNSYIPNKYIFGGGVVGINLEHPIISLIDSGFRPGDEQRALSSGGSMIYSHQILSRGAGGIKIDIPLTCAYYDHNCSPQDVNSMRQWHYYGYWFHENINVAPNYYKKIFNEASDINMVFGGLNGVYGDNNMVSALIPYKGALLTRTFNAIVQLKPGLHTSIGLEPIKKPTLTSMNFDNNSNESNLISLLEKEVEKIILAGHLRPGYGIHGGIAEGLMSSYGSMEDYYHEPHETVLTLSLAYPHINLELRQKVKDYLEYWYLSDRVDNFPVWKYSHIGWQSGSKREWADLSPSAEIKRAQFSPRENIQYPGYQSDPMAFYALYKYVINVENGNSQKAKYFLQKMNDRLAYPPFDHFQEYPFVCNAFIGGYYGYLELQKHAQLEQNAAAQTALENMKIFRKNNFNKNFLMSDYFSKQNHQIFNISRNFLYITPELSDYLYNNISFNVSTAIDEYVKVAPYWFVGFAEEGALDANKFVPLYDKYAMFQAKSQILNASKEELEQYLDVPVFARGDLFYIQNLVSAIEAPSSAPPPACTLSSDVNCDTKVNILDISALISNFGKTAATKAEGDTNTDGVVNILDLSSVITDFGKTQ